MNKYTNTNTYMPNCLNDFEEKEKNERCKDVLIISVKELLMHGKYHNDLLGDNT